LLPFKSERSVKKLIEGLPFYRDKLHEETVFERFTEILNKVCVTLLVNFHIEKCGAGSPEQVAKQAGHGAGGV
jgi:hypothetical protein